MLITLEIRFVLVFGVYGTDTETTVIYDRVCVSGLVCFLFGDYIVYVVDFTYNQLNVLPFNHCLFNNILSFKLYRSLNVVFNLLESIHVTMNHHAYIKVIKSKLVFFSQT